jgi:hypothetical protein
MPAAEGEQGRQYVALRWYTLARQRKAPPGGPHGAAQKNLTIRLPSATHGAEAQLLTRSVDDHYHQHAPMALT